MASQGCAACESEGAGWIRVSPTTHPDERLWVCGECEKFIREAQTDLRTMFFFAGNIS